MSECNPVYSVELSRVDNGWVAKIWRCEPPRMSTVIGKDYDEISGLVRAEIVKKPEKRNRQPLAED